MQICIDLVLLDELMLMQDASKLTYYLLLRVYLRTLPDMHGPQRRKRVSKTNKFTYTYLPCTTTTTAVYHSFIFRGFMKHEADEDLKMKKREDRL